MVNGAVCGCREVAGWARVSETGKLCVSVAGLHVHQYA